MKRNKPHINIPQGMNKDTDTYDISNLKYLLGENAVMNHHLAINRMTDSIRAHHTKILSNKISITRSEYLYKHWYSNDLNINIDLIFKRYIRNRWTRTAKQVTDKGIKVHEDLEKSISPSGRYIIGVDPYHSDSNQGEGIIIRTNYAEGKKGDMIVAEYFSRNQSIIDKEDNYNKWLELASNKDVIINDEIPISYLEEPINKKEPVDKYKTIILEQLSTNSVSINMKFNHDSSIRIYNNNIDMTLMQPDVVDAIKQLLIKTLK